MDGQTDGWMDGQTDGWMDGCAIVQAVSLQLLTAEAHVRVQAVHVGFVVDKVAVVQVFVDVLHFTFVSSVTPPLLHIHSSGGWAVGPLAVQFYIATIPTYVRFQVLTAASMKLVKLMLTDGQHQLDYTALHPRRL
jgi:hypothetical protein